LIIDCHLHCFPWIGGVRDGKAATKGDRFGFVYRVEENSVEKSRYMPPSFHNTSSQPEVALAYMEDAGVDKAVLMQSQCYGNHNEFISSLVSKWPKKFVGMALVDPQQGGKELIASMRHAILELGLKGFKFEIPDIPFHPGDPQYLPMWKEIRKLDVPVVIDLGWGEGDYYFDLDGIHKVLGQVEGLRMVLAHLGVSRLWDPKEQYPFPTLQRTLSLAKKFSTVMFDVAGLTNATQFMGTAEEEYPFQRMQKALKAAYEEVGAERMMWGSDYPSVLLSCTYGQLLSIFWKHCNFLSGEEKNEIMGINAMRFFNFDGE